jgi:glycogen(starch) synthase
LGAKDVDSVDTDGQPARPPLRISIVVNTDGRAAALRQTIESFRHLDYDQFEVVVVCGPTPDGTREVGMEYAARDWIKYVECPERNLSRSRNLGIKHASGDVVAFIDDDAMPQPEWLAEIAPAFDDPATGGAGGLVFDHTGYSYQYRFASCDRLGSATIDLNAPIPEHNFPFSNVFPYLQGTNCAFRRDRLVEIGGFDEEYEFYLDETDVCCRLVDAGWTIRQLPNAPVHHKYLPSSIRNEHRVTINKYSIIKNKIYFSIVNNRGHFGFMEIIDSALRFARGERADLEFHIGGGRLPQSALENFELDAERAFQVGLTRSLSGQRRTQPAAYFAAPPAVRRFPRLKASGERRNFVFMSRSYPPKAMGGIVRYTHDIVRAIAAAGHTVHVLTEGEDFNRVDLEEGVWVHRIVPKAQVPRELPGSVAIPRRIWDYSATLLEEIWRIDSMVPVDAVEAVSWDCEAIAVVTENYFPSATNVVTTISHWLDTFTHFRENAEWMEQFGTPMMAAERHIFAESPALIAASRAIASSIEDRYHLDLAAERVGFIGHGMADMAPLTRKRPADIANRRPDDGRLAILFVGRLEKRKGIDVLLESARELLQQHPLAELWIAGDDRLQIAPGQTVKAAFLNDAATLPIRDRIFFLGAVAEAELRWLYANCDLFVAPSRFESFGLILLEAMMFAKACIGGRAGGMEEIIEDGENGFLVAPGDAAELTRVVDGLLKDPALRERVGHAGRRHFEQTYIVDVVTERRIQFLSSLARQELPLEEMDTIGHRQRADVGFGKQAWALGPGSELTFVSSARHVFITFWKHDWSGIAEILVAGRVAQRIDLHSPSGCFETVAIKNAAKGAATFVIRRSGLKSSTSNDSQVIIHSIKEQAAALPGVAASSIATDPDYQEHDEDRDHKWRM